MKVTLQLELTSITQLGRPSRRLEVDYASAPSMPCRRRRYPVAVFRKMIPRKNHAWYRCFGTRGSQSGRAHPFALLQQGEIIDKLSLAVVVEPATKGR